MSEKELAGRVAELEARVAALEGIAEQVLADTGGVVSYQGRLTEPGELDWTITLPVSTVLGLPDGPRLEVLAALGHPVRAKVVRVLAQHGPQGAAELQAAAEVGSTGQLYHHLKPLTTSGLVDQDGRGRYRLRATAMVPVLILLAAAADIAGQLKS
ncbi:winged helix-turn-helix domain-containing protein [Crossiella cryophila]|uniref:DNA-binding transcriptional ArsR family regulator n=1 Tax=Crossiella cryophila TaxID=43355 RepID=A0A7W7FT40_9PSEU|nr:helix-turn-helix domain-containing protein [Crossiella cryophila]MBB4676625.1 DNA-binding transcriptional ArsR family regulator [Crossiella cryophila]